MMQGTDDKTGMTNRAKVKNRDSQIARNIPVLQRETNITTARFGCLSQYPAWKWTGRIFTTSGPAQHIKTGKIINKDIKVIDIWTVGSRDSNGTDA